MIFDGIHTRKDFVKIIDSREYEKCVEVGICKGNNSAWLLDNSKLNVLYGVENWSVRNCKKCREETEERMAKYGRRFQWKVGASLDMADQFEDNSIDFLYIDGDHRYKDISKDIKKWYPKVRLGGFFGGHDYVVARKCGVIQAVDEFFESIDRQFSLTNPELDEENISFWMIK
jgi:hypothetical protein